MTKYTNREPYIIGGDFETDYDEETGRRYICEWAISEGHDFCWYGRDGESFKKQLLGILMGSGNTHAKNHVMIYFHNLKYDASYMMDFYVEMEKRGFKSILAVDEMKSPISLKFTLGCDKNPHTTLEFRDSKRKLNKSLREVGAMIGLPKLEPDDADFKPGWSKKKDYTNPQAFDYVKEDARIVGKAMRMLHEGVEGFRFTGPTISSDAWRLCRDVCEREWASEHDKGCRVIGADTSKTPLSFAVKFPPLPPRPVCDATADEPVLFMEKDYEALVGKDKVTDNEIREAYWGGINYSAHNGSNHPDLDGEIYHIDYHSMYPSQMVHRLLPYGRCKKVIELDGPIRPKRDYNPEDEVYFTELFVTKMKLKPGMIPWYHLKNSGDKKIEGLKQSEPVVEFKHPHIITVTSIEYEDLKLYYDMETVYDLPYELRQRLMGEQAPSMEYIIRPRAWVYKAKKGLLKPYIDLCYNQKEKWGKIDKGGLWYNFWKTLMNSVYGRMAMNPYRKEAEIVWNEKIETYVWNLRADTLHVIENFNSYVPYSAFVCAWARHQLTQAWIEIGCENVLHSDTDSIVFRGKGYPTGLSITDSQLDTWGDECKGPDGKSLIGEFVAGGVKRYVEITKPFEDFKPGDRLKDYVNTAMAGIPKQTKVFNGIEVPVGMWVPILDRPTLIAEDFDLGDEHYKAQSEWLRNLYLSAGLDPDDIDTSKLMAKHSKGGIDLVKSRFKASSGFSHKYR